MNTNYLELLQKKMISEMAKAINETVKDTGCEETAEDVFDNIDKLYEEIPQIEFGQTTGEVIKFMPKQYKEMVMRLISPTYSMLTTVEWFNDHVTANASLYFDRHDSKPIATAKSCYYFDRMDKNLTEEEKRSTAELAARGFAESKCLQKFGIGAWFKGYYSAEEEPEKIKPQNNGGEFLPTIIPTEEPISEKTTAPTNVEDTVEEQMTFDFFNFSETSVTDADISSDLPENSTTIIPEEPVNDTTSTTQAKVKCAKKSKDKETPSAVETTETELSYDEALSTFADIGMAKSKGYNLKDVIEKQPRHLAWLYTNGCGEKVKKAIEVIVSNNIDIKVLFDEKNIKI